jgi:hypothetical protein
MNLPNGSPAAWFSLARSKFCHVIGILSALSMHLTIAGMWEWCVA